MSDGSFPSLVSEHRTTRAAFDAAASHSSTPSASAPSSLTPATATSFPSSSTLPPAVAAPSPLAAPGHEEGVPLPQSLVHEKRQNYAAPSEDLQRRRNITLSANFLASEGLQNLIHEKEELTSKRDQLLAERDQTVLRLSELETRATEAAVSEGRAWRRPRPRVNLEVALNSKSEELAAVEVKHAHLEEKYRKTIKHNRLLSSTVRELDVSLKYARSAQENLRRGGSEGDEAEDQTGESVEPSAELPTLPGNADTSLPPGPRGAVD
uniref:Uncharacterized protein n=1 Tax=Nicotiana tabacum TaxID=4097 RepID=A0A1S3YTV0_TOBAC|nr:PREDICTED: uncharacterized protein LOC107779629 [Nicotiana tabacum]